MEARTGDVGTVIRLGLGPRSRHHRGEAGQHEVRAAVRHVPGARRARRVPDRRPDRHLVCGTAWMTETGWLFVGLNAIVAFVLGALGYAVVKFITAARALAR